MNFAKHFGLSFMLCFAKFFGHRSKTTHRVVFSLRSNPFSILAPKKQEAPPNEDASCFWRRGRDSNPRVLSHKLISRNRGDVTIRPSASLIFEKSTDFSAFLLPICQIFRKSDRKVIENEVGSALNTIFSNQHFRLYIRQSVCL